MGLSPEHIRWLHAHRYIHAMIHERRQQPASRTEVMSSGIWSLQGIEAIGIAS